MGSNARSARPGLNSGIGKRSMRSSNSSSTPKAPHPSPLLLSPASTSPRTSSSPRKKNPAPSLFSRRSSTASRASRKPHRPAAPRPESEEAEEPDEFIADIIVVNTESPEGFIDMDDEASETMMPGEIVRSDPHTSCIHQQSSPDHFVSAQGASDLVTESEPANTYAVGTSASEPAATEEISRNTITADDSPVEVPLDVKGTDSTPLEPSFRETEAPQVDSSAPPSINQAEPLESPSMYLAVRNESTVGECVIDTGPPFLELETAVPPVAGSVHTEAGPEDLETAGLEPARSDFTPMEVKGAAQFNTIVDSENVSPNLGCSKLSDEDVATFADSAAPTRPPVSPEHLTSLSENSEIAGGVPTEPIFMRAHPVEEEMVDPVSNKNDGNELQSHREATMEPEAAPGSSAASSQLSDLTDFDLISPSQVSDVADETLEVEAIDNDADEVSSELSDLVSPDPEPANATLVDSTPAKSAISHLIGDTRNSFASSVSARTEQSGLSSKPPSVSSKATTPFDTDSPRDPASQPVPLPTHIGRIQSRSRRTQFNVRPKVSVPTDLTAQEYAIECIEAAENSRLNPYALHQEEYLLLRCHLSHAQVTTYLNIRNGILRLWVRNPQIAVTRQEAIGCARDARWFDVANLCFDWLVRRGFINYGCVEIRQHRRKPSINEDSQTRKRKTVVVIGAGFSGLGCARQLEGLFTQYSKRFRSMGEDPPRVIVLEGRNRVGGRVYSRAFQTLPDTAPGIFRGKRFTAEMGGMIITGFDRGNPLNILVRGQLSLPYHCLRSDMSLYDTNGTAVDPARDEMVEHLFNACLDRVSEYKFKPPPSKLVEGNHDLVDEGRDSTAEGHKTIALEEEKLASLPHAPPISQQNVTPGTHLVPVSTDRMTGKIHVEPGTHGSTGAAFKAKSLGWTLRPGVPETRDIDLDAAARDSSATLGSVVDEALMQHKGILDLSAQDFRLLNWHIANLEYSNATNLNRLSLKGWDIDAGNEWEGKHTMVVGGYQSVARGLSMLPTPLDIRHKATVKRIKYSNDGTTGPARIDLEDGQSVEADYVVNTIPLGVLKHGGIEFQPPLPSWKSDVIERLGFGVLNKVILVYKEAFWDKDRDIFGTLQTPTNRSSLNQKDYVSRRGRFFQWFNVTNTTGMPCLLALMAGDAGYDTEITPNDELIAEATEVLRMRYGARVPSQPLEAVVTRWESDRFARGSYSNAGVKMQAEDYQIMARSVGNLHFAGEHTIVTHPATVHGAYLSGLRAASDVLEEMIGPIEIPVPLVLPRETSASLKRKAQEENKDPVQARLEAYEMEIQEHIYSKLGPYPIKPSKVAGSPYILFNKIYYEEGRKRCEEGRRVGKGKPNPNEIRTMTSKMWREAAPEIRQPFEEAAEEQKRNYTKALMDWTAAAAKWEEDAVELRQTYIHSHPSVPGPEELGSDGGVRRAKRLESYAEEDSDLDMD